VRTDRPRKYPGWFPPGPMAVVVCKRHHRAWLATVRRATYAGEQELGGVQVFRAKRATVEEERRFKGFVARVPLQWWRSIERASVQTADAELLEFHGPMPAQLEVWCRKCRGWAEVDRADILGKIAEDDHRNGCASPLRVQPKSDC
jgi:hypothetical protein